MSLRLVCFTINNYTQDLYDDLVRYDWRYIVIGKEVGDSGTPHLQCFGAFHRKQGVVKLAKRWSTHLKKLYDNSTPEAAATYCKKGGDFYERGDMPDDGGAKGGKVEKARWAGIIAKAEAGKLEEIKADEPEVYLRCYATLKRMKQDAAPALPDIDIDNYWIWGAAGVGKSRKARDMCNGVFYPKPMSKWWDCYQGEDNIILDDFEKKAGEMLGHHLKIWGDRYDFIAENKGGSIRIRPKMIIVTSNYSPEECFEDGELLAAIRRRFKVVNMINPF